MNLDSKAISRKLLLAFGALVFSLILLEGGLRLLRPVHYWQPVSHSEHARMMCVASPIAGLSYELAPNRESFPTKGVRAKTNSYGMRDRERTLQKSPGIVRIAAIGDSYTFGYGVAAEEAFPSVLERMLNDSTPGTRLRYEVLNFGIPGYCSRDEALVLKYKVLPWNPDLVILGYVLNDPEIDPIQWLHQTFDEPLWWQHSHLLRLIARAKNNWDIRRLGGGDYYRYLHAPGEPKWASVVQAFQDIRDATSPRHIKVMLLIFPEVGDKSWASSWANYPYRQLHKQVADLGVKDGFTVLDLLDAFAGHGPRDLIFTGHDEHPNAEGHRLTAKAISERLLQEYSASSSTTK